MTEQPPRCRVWRAGVVRWLCDNPRCPALPRRRFLATIEGDTFRTPEGVKGHLPAVIECPICHQPSARGGVAMPGGER